MNKLRKFGLEHCELPTMLSNISTLLRVLTLNIDPKYKKGISIYSYIITTVTAASYLYTCLFSVLWFVFWRCTATGDLVAATVVFSMGTTTEMGNLKLIYIAFNNDKVKKIVTDCLACDSRIMPGSRFHINQLKALRTVKKRVIMYWMLLAVNGILYISMPLIMPGRNLPTDILVIYGLEPMMESPNYEVIWFLLINSVFFICYVSGSVSAFFMVIAGYIESQILALSEEMLYIWPLAIQEAVKEIGLDQFELTNNEIIINKYVAHHLRRIIAHHGSIISLFRQVEDLFKGAIIMGLLLLTLGMIAAFLGKLENTFLQLPFTFILLAIDCFVGQRVIDACIVFERAVYECQWEKFDKSNMKMVQVMVQVSQKTMTLSAGGIAILNFTYLLSIIRGIYSTYTALRSTVK